MNILKLNLNQILKNMSDLSDSILKYFYFHQTIQYKLTTNSSNNSKINKKQNAVQNSPSHQ